MLECLVQGYEMLVRAQDLGEDYRRHALFYMHYGQLLLRLEYMRHDHVLLLIGNPTNRRALQVFASASS